MTRLAADGVHHDPVAPDVDHRVHEHLLDFYRRKSRPLPPTFTFVDPFGWKGAPFEPVKTILQSPSCEVLVNFMFEEINRFIGHPDQQSNFDALFGTADWRQMLHIVEPRKRRDFPHDLYLRQFRIAAGAKYVRSFEMRNDKDVTDYFLFFATNNPKGIAKMKAAMWKVDQEASSAARTPRSLRRRSCSHRSRTSRTFGGHLAAVRGHGDHGGRDRGLCARRDTVPGDPLQEAGAREA